MTNLATVTSEDLRAVAAEIAGISVDEVPATWIYHHPRAEVSRAVTIRNALSALKLATATGKITLTGLPWHASYFGRPKALIATLVSDGLLGPQRQN